MKPTPFHFFVLPAAMFIASFAMAAADYQALSAQDGIEVMISYNPLGPNNEIVAYLKFVNNNNYAVDVTWKPVISCGDAAPKEGAGGAFSVNAKASYGVTLWRSAVCGLMKIRNFKVDMQVKKP